MGLGASVTDVLVASGARSRPYSRHPQGLTTLGNLKPIEWTTSRLSRGPGFQKKDDLEDEVEIEMFSRWPSFEEIQPQVLLTQLAG
jgi:hypothetical protein